MFSSWASPLKPPKKASIKTSIVSVVSCIISFWELQIGSKWRRMKFINRAMNLFVIPGLIRNPEILQGIPLLDAGSSPAWQRWCISKDSISGASCIHYYKWDDSERSDSLSTFFHGWPTTNTRQCQICKYRVYRAIWQAKLCLEFLESKIHYQTFVYALIFVDFWETLGTRKRKKALYF